MPAGLFNAFSVDVEDYFQVYALERSISRSQWNSLPCRVENNVHRLLEHLSATDNHATFFVLGWIAERYPTLIRQIATAGHEVASHGYDHRRVNEMSRQSFADDVRRTKTLLEDTISAPIIGYRAPNFSFGSGTPWAYDVLIETGHAYSSSVYPVRHDHYGSPMAPRFTHRVNESIWEVPPATVRMFGNNVPAGGGGYFRFYPYALSSWLIRRLNRVENRPAVFYCHPWEIDPDQPHVSGLAYRFRLRHYINLSRAEQRVRKLLCDHRWERIDRVFGFARAGP